jgi:hypothetical protein
MASSPSIVTTSGKAINQSKSASSSSPSVFQSLHQPQSSGDTSGFRRSGGSSFGAGSWAKQQPNPRNSQTKKPNKNSKKYPKLDDDAIAEASAMRSTTSRKGQTSITHLMNYSIRPSHNSSSAYFPTSHRYRPRANPSDDRSRFVYGNYRFIIDPDYDYQMIDADKQVDWNHILQIIASSDSQSGCPICLETPVAPRMVKCGHIFCLPCLVRFLHTNTEDDQPKYEKRSKPNAKACPLCWDHVTLTEAKPVKWHQGQEIPVTEGNDVVLKLMRRSAGTTLALPRDGAAADNTQVPWYYEAEVQDYARIMKGTTDYMVEQIDQEIKALREQETLDELMFGDDNTEWVRKSVKSLNELRSRFASQEASSIPTETHDTQQTISRTSTFSSSPTRARRHQPFQQAPASEYYFYQALPHYYLSSLDIRILKQAFGSYGSFPATILPHVEKVSTGHVVDEDLRKRNKWLSHLPRGCEVNFLECDWTDTVSAEVLELFREEIEARRKRNSEKEVREERDRLRAEREEEKRYAYLRRRRNEDSPPRQTFHRDDFVPLQGEHDADDTDTSFGNRDGASFAPLANMSTSPSASRTVWGTAVVAPTTPPLNAIRDNSADDGWFQGWEEALLEEQVSQIDAATGDKPKVQSSKKKKAKKITLMSTTVRRGA